MTERQKIICGVLERDLNYYDDFNVAPARLREIARNIDAALAPDPQRPTIKIIADDRVPLGWVIAVG